MEPAGLVGTEPEAQRVGERAMQEDFDINSELLLAGDSGLEDEDLRADGSSAVAAEIEEHEEPNARELREVLTPHAQNFPFLLLFVTVHISPSLCLGWLRILALS